MTLDKPLHLHDDAVTFRDEHATVSIGRCPVCGEDTEWSFSALASQPDVEDARRRDEAHALGYREGYRKALAAQPDVEALRDRIALSFADGRPEAIDEKDEWWTTPRALADEAVAAIAREYAALDRPDR